MHNLTSGVLNEFIVWLLLSDVIVTMTVQNRIVVLLLFSLMFICTWMFSYIIDLNNNISYLLKEVQELELELTKDGGHRYEPFSNDGNMVERAKTPRETKHLDHLVQIRETIPTIQPAGKGQNSNHSNSFRMPNIDGFNVVSMSLWGSDGRYINGALSNADLVKIFFPGWTLRIYTEKRTSGSASSPKYPVVPAEAVDKLRSLGTDIHYVDPHETNVPAMMWRFLIADDLSVDHFIIRDTDSRLSSRDAAAVYQWILSGKPFHCIRDHPSHANYALSGGLWGGRPSGLRDIFRRPFKEIMFGYRDDYIQDMKFLIDIVWPRVQLKAFCSDSVSCDKYPASHPYPVPRHGYEFVGEVYDAEGLRRPVDISILRDAGVNDLCVPPDGVRG